MIKLIKPQSIFNIYRTQLEFASSVFKMNLGAVISKCANNIFKSSKIKTIEALITNSCRQRIITLTSNKDLRNKFSLNEKKFVNEVLYNIIKDKQFHLVNTFLSNIKKDKVFYHFMSSNISELFWTQKIDIPNKTLQKLDQSADITTSFYEKEHNLKGTLEIFYGEIKELSRSLAKTLNSKDVDKNEVESLVNKMLTFLKLNEENFPKEKTRNLLNNIGKTLLSKHFYSNSEKIYRVSLKLSSAEDYDESLFNLFWVYLMKEDYSEANNFITQHSLKEKFDSLPSSLQFWTAFTIEMNQHKKEALALYFKIIEKFGFDFYSIFSAKRYLELGGEKNKIEIQLKELVKESPIPADISLKDFGPEYFNSLKRVVLWAHNNELDMVESETNKTFEPSYIEHLFKGKKLNSLPSSVKKELNTMMISNVLSSSGQYLLSFSVIHNNMGPTGIAFNKSILQSLYPTPYFKKIKEIEDEIDPVLVLSLIRQESGFNPHARSRVGARGLMQLMPATARQVHRKIATVQLDHPETNLKIGIKYFKRLFSKYSGNLVYTLAAYNAGERNLQRWITDVFRSESTLHTIESIPFSETRTYVKLIFRNIFFYKFLQLQSLDNKNISSIFNWDLEETDKK